MDKINAVITGVGGYVPEDVLTNEDISKLVDTTDEWIMTRVGIKERRILKGEGLGTSYMGIRAVKQLLEKTNVNPEEIEVILTATTTPDHHFPTTSVSYTHLTLPTIYSVVFCMPWKQVPIISVRDAIRKWLLWQAIK